MKSIFSNCSNCFTIFRGKSCNFHACKSKSYLEQNVGVIIEATLAALKWPPLTGGWETFPTSPPHSQWQCQQGTWGNESQQLLLLLSRFSIPIFFKDSQIDLGSISSTFYKQLFHTKVFCAAFLYLQFVFIILSQNKIGKKAAHKMLVKLGWSPLRQNVVVIWKAENPDENILCIS